MLSKVRKKFGIQFFLLQVLLEKYLHGIAPRQRWTFLPQIGDKISSLFPAKPNPAALEDPSRRLFFEAGGGG